MGLYDRDYTQFEDRSEPHFGGQLSSHPAWLIILVINVAAFLINGLFFNRSDWLTTTLSVHDETLYQPWMWWRWFTYGFAHADLRHILFNMLGLFFFGSAMERRLGKAEFTRFYIAAVLVGGMVWSLLTALSAAGGGDAAEQRAIMLGASGAVEAVCILFCFFYPHAKILLFFVLPVKAWIVGVGFVVMNLMGALGDRGAGVDSTAFDVHLAGIAFAAAYHLGRWNLGAVMPDWLGGSGGGGSAGGFARRFRSRPKLRLHDPDKKLAKEAAEADRVLQKIHDSGEASLTSAERRLLERYSRRIRGK